MKVLGNIKKLSRSPLARKNTLGVIKLAFIIAVVLTLIEIFLIYENEYTKQHQQIELLSESRANSIALSIWNTDVEQTMLLLNEMHQLDYVAYIRLKTDTNLDIEVGQKPGTSNSYVHTRPLVLQLNNESYVAGELIIEATPYHLFNAHNLIIIANEIIKTLIIAFLVMLVLYKLTIRHLLTISDYLNKVRIEDDFAPLILDKEIVNNDELDIVASNLNKLLHKLKLSHTKLITHQEELEAAIKERTLEYKNAKLDAQRANKAKTTFLTHTTHELRTPLNAILGYAQFLEMDLTDEVQKEYLSQIVNAGHHQLTLINELLDISKIEAGIIELDMQNIPLNKLIEECISLNQNQALSQHIKIMCEFSEDYLINTDRIKLKQVLLNLISNAIKYNKHGGKVTIRTEVNSDDFIKISIHDTGIGLNEKQQEMLFQSYNRVGAEATTIEGTGIGLVITKQIVELMGGEIGLSSTSGVGSTFWLTIKHKIDR